MTTHHGFDIAVWAATILNQYGFEAYIVGGAVRDLYLGQEPKDFDLATNATPQEIMALPEFSHSRYKDTAQAYGVTRALFTHRGQMAELEIATFRRDIQAHKGRTKTKVAFSSLEDDVLRRDFTINGLAYNPATQQIIDFVDGVQDIEQGTIRFIGKPSMRITEDPLRILRAIRFKNRLGFEYDEATSLAIQISVDKGAIGQIAIDRLRDEFTRMLMHWTRRQAIIDLYDFGILQRVLPEVVAGMDVAQPPEFHSEGDVWEHELLTLDYLPKEPSRRLAWAALLHDIGKKPTFRPANDHERIHFYNHYSVGAEMARAILHRLRFSNRDIRDISWIIYNHMAIDDLPNMRRSRQRQMLANPAFADLLELHQADAAASWAPGGKHTKPDFKNLQKIWHDYLAEPPSAQQPSLKHDLGIDGNWLLQNFGELPGPQVGKILRKLEEWYIDEGVTAPKKYLAKARIFLKQNNS